MVCPSCDVENPTGSKFCNECGTRLTLVCPSCGAANVPRARFCIRCGFELAESPQSGASSTSEQAAPAPVAERRLVSILFADLVGFTPFAEQRDAEEVRDTLSRYFELASDVITRYGGTVEKFIGDAIAAVWGAPTAHEDDAERAVRAALELVDAVRGLGSGVEARAAVVTGEAAVTIGATNQGMVAGDLVNTASRLQSAAAPGTVLVGDATRRAASRSIVFESAGDRRLKGKTAPVRAWRALRVTAEAGGQNGPGALEAPFVGRDDELRLLKELFHATSREHRARLVSVTGTGGIGKSRLVWEFGKYLDGLIEPVWWHQGRSPAYGEGITFWALGEMVRERAGLLETDDEPTTRAKIAETVARHVPDEADQRWIEPALLTLLGLDAGVVESDELFAAWRAFFERLAATGAVVMVFEDLQAADPGLLNFIDGLLEWSRALPIYVLTLARPELLDQRPNWASRKRSFTSVYLEPLPRDSMRKLVAGLMPGLPEQVMTSILARADGVPLFAVETARMLLADDRLTLQDGVFRPAGDLTTLAVPETLTALIASRLDALPARDRALVSDAAVLGHTFTLAGLSAVSRVPEFDLIPRLNILIQRELLAREANVRSPERGQYKFVQDLIREVAYNTLTKHDRKTRHIAAAHFFESLGTGEIAGGLAGHYVAAHRNSSKRAEADAVANQARVALKAAAERATALSAHDQAVAFCDQALAFSDDPAETADLLERAGEAAFAAGREDAAEAHLRRAIEGHRAVGDRLSTARATAALGRALLSAFRSADALALLERAAIEFSDLGAEPSAAIGSQLARAYLFVDDNQRAIEVADRVLDIAERADLAGLVADTLVTKGSALVFMGRTVEGLGTLNTASDLAEANGLGATVLRAHINRSSIESTRDPRAGLEMGRAALTLARRLGRRGDAVAALRNAARSALQTGDWFWAFRRDRR